MTNLTTWDHIQNILERTLSPGLYQIWIKPLSAVVTDDRLAVQAPNEFVAAWVRERLCGQISEAALQVMGKTPLVTVEAKTEDALDPQAARIARLSDGAGHPVVPVPAVAAQAPDKGPLFRFSYDQFVVGPSNALAYEASLGVCRGTLAADQLFICAGPGLGKTHLSQAMGHLLVTQEQTARPKVVYLTAEEFSSRLILAFKTRDVERFKAQFRENLDILILEDIHFFQGKPKLQDELLNTVKALRSRGCRVVFTSSFLPKELTGLDTQLASRLCAGFMATIEQPDLETRLNILERKAKVQQASLPGEVAGLLAKHIKTDIRQLESCLQNLIFKARILGQAISVEMARDILRNYEIARTGLEIDEIVEFICSIYNIKPESLISKSRKRQHVVARNTAFFLARQHTALSLADIGGRFNRRHSTVVKGITAVERQISLQTPLGRQIEATVERLAR